MPFYDVLCPLVPENEKGKKGTRGRKVRDNETNRHIDQETMHYLLCPFMTFYALWCPRMKRVTRVPRGRKVRDNETWRTGLLTLCASFCPFMPFVRRVGGGIDDFSYTFFVDIEFFVYLRIENARVSNYVL